MEITAAEAQAAYDCLQADMAGYSRSGLAVASDYPGWVNVATAPYPSDTHGGRYVNNYVNSTGAAAYQKYEDIGTAPVGTVVAKDSMAVKPNGKVSVGPLFVMEKMAAGFNGDTGDWKYSMIMPNGAVIGVTNGKGSGKVAFCADCHNAAEDQDRLFFLPEEFRKK